MSEKRAVIETLLFCEKSLVRKKASRYWGYKEAGLGSDITENKPLRYWQAFDRV